MRPRAAEPSAIPSVAEAAANSYERGRQRLEEGQVREGLADLEEAARVSGVPVPCGGAAGARVRGARTGAMPASSGSSGRRTVPAPSREAGLAVLYELGVALDGVGERARALAVLMEIESDEPNYRDVRAASRRPRRGRKTSAGDDAAAADRLLVEVGLVLAVAPWSAFWERNYFAGMLPMLHAVITNDFFRGASLRAGPGQSRRGGRRSCGRCWRRGACDDPIVRSTSPPSSKMMTDAAGDLHDHRRPARGRSRCATRWSSRSLPPRGPACT